MSRFITLTTHIAASVETCFLLSLSIDLHKESMKSHHEKAVSGTTSGIISPGETVTWKARHLGLNWHMTTLISKYQHPFYFVSEMINGPFAKFHHQHIFKENGIHTIMTDIVEFKGPLGILGSFAEWLFLEKRMRKTLEERNRVIKKTAQTDEWKKYLTESPMIMEKAG